MMSQHTGNVQKGKYQKPGIENLILENNKQESRTIYQVSTFKPEQCGIAAWTEDKINYSHGVNPLFRNRVIAINGFRNLSEYADPVDFGIERDNKKDYVLAAEFANENGDMASIQHEFGIFGGDRGKFIGDYLLDFLDNLKKPVMMTAHTVLGDVDDERSIKRKELFKEIIPKANHIIAISNTSRELLIKEYGVIPDKITMVYHGVHDFNETIDHSRQIIGGLEGRFVISTVGLVRSKRGFEQVIRALPRVVEKHPDLLYMIAGKTHPKEFGLDGSEPYREKLQEEVKNLNLENNVLFINKWLPLTSLLRYIQASDMAITPYTDPKQISSGVLSYNLGLLKPVISTPFAYAKEVLADGRGIVLPDFNNPESISDALIYVLDNREIVKKMQEKITPFREQMRWPNVAKKYIEVEQKLIDSY